MERFIWALAYIFPAYVANATPVVAVRILGRAHPIDGRVVFVDGKRLLGDGKTYEGLAAGIGFGSVVGFAMLWILPTLFRSHAEIIIMTAGAMLGDIAGAFVKRRLGIPHGRAAPPLDQLSFFAGSLVLIAATLGAPSWLDAQTIAYLVILTFFMHVGTNSLAYVVGLKDRWY